MKGIVLISILLLIQGLHSAPCDGPYTFTSETWNCFDYSPLSVPEPSLWLRADNPDSILSSEDVTVWPSDVGDVSAHLGSSCGGPRLVTDDGRPYLDFSLAYAPDAIRGSCFDLGEHQIPHHRVSDPPSRRGFTVIAVVAPVGNSRPLLNLGRWGGSLDGAAWVMEAGTSKEASTSMWSVLGESTAQDTLGSGSSSRAWTIVTSLIQPQDDGFTSTFIDGELLSKVDVTTSGSAGDWTMGYSSVPLAETGPVTIGSPSAWAPSTGTSQVYVGKLAEMITYDVLLSPQELVLVSEYLGRKYSIDRVACYNHTSAVNGQCDVGIYCGDGYISPGEECDDGNIFDGDGCSSSCTKEWGWDCSAGNMTVCTRRYILFLKNNENTAIVVTINPAANVSATVVHTIADALTIGWKFILTGGYEYTWNAMPSTPASQTIEFVSTTSLQLNVLSKVSSNTIASMTGAGVSVLHVTGAWTMDHSVLLDNCVVLVDSSSLSVYASLEMRECAVAGSSILIEENGRLNMTGGGFVNRTANDVGLIVHPSMSVGVQGGQATLDDVVWYGQRLEGGSSSTPPHPNSPQAAFVQLTGCRMEDVTARGGVRIQIQDTVSWKQTQLTVINNGVLRVDGLCTGLSDISVSNSAEVELWCDAAWTAPSLTLSESAKWFVHNFTATLSGNMDCSASTQVHIMHGVLDTSVGGAVQLGTLHVQGPSAVALVKGTASATVLHVEEGGVIEWDTTFFKSVSEVILQGGVIRSHGGLDVSGDVTWDEGSVVFGGALNVHGTLTGKEGQVCVAGGLYATALLVTHHETGHRWDTSVDVITAEVVVEEYGAFGVVPWSVMCSSLPWAESTPLPAAINEPTKVTLRNGLRIVSSNAVVYARASEEDTEPMVIHNTFVMNGTLSITIPLTVNSSGDIVDSIFNPTGLSEVFPFASYVTPVDPPGMFHSIADVAWAEGHKFVVRYIKKTGQGIVYVELRGCEPGHFSSTYARVCELCPVGEYVRNPGATSCAPCPVGSVTETSGLGNVACEDCHMGSYQHNSTDCVVCAPGSYSSEHLATSCTKCAKGYYQDHPQQERCEFCDTTGYADEEGLPLCKLCFEGTIAKEFGAESPMDCMCPAGEYGEAGGPCEPCPTGAVCDYVGTVIPEAAPGWWSRPDGTIAYFACIPREACIGKGECAPGYLGDICAVCDSNYYRMGGQCWSCSEVWMIHLLRFFLVLWFIALAVGFLYFASYSGSPRIYGSIIVGISHFQFVAHYSTIRLSWGNRILRAFNSALLVMPDPSLAMSQCTLKGDPLDIAERTFVMEWIVRWSMPWMFFAFFAMVYFGSILHGKMVDRWGERFASKLPKFCEQPLDSGIGDPPSRKDFMRYRLSTFFTKHLDVEQLAELRVRCMNAMLAVLTFLYFSLCRVVMEGLDCTVQPDNVQTLDAFPAATCGVSPVAKAVMPFAVIGIFLYIIGIPVVVLLSLTFFNFRLNDEEYIRRFSLTCVRYRASWYYWEVINMFRRLTFVVGTLMFTLYPVFQSMIAVLTLFCFTLVQLSVKPFVSHRLDMLEFVLAVGLEIQLFSGVVTHAATDSHDLYQLVMDIVVLVIHWLSTALVVLLIFYEIWRSRRGLAREGKVFARKGGDNLEDVVERTAREKIAYLLDSNDFDIYDLAVWLRGVSDREQDRVVVVMERLYHHVTNHLTPEELIEFSTSAGTVWKYHILPLLEAYMDEGSRKERETASKVIGALEQFFLEDVRGGELYTQTTLSKVSNQAAVRRRKGYARSSRSGRSASIDFRPLELDQLVASMAMGESLPEDEQEMAEIANEL